MGIKGDFGGLRRIGVQLKTLGAPDTRAQLSRVLMHEALELVDDGFATSKAPDGTRWKRLKFRNGQPLRDTRRLQSSFTGQSSARGFIIGTNTHYAVTHQEGRVIKAKGDGRLRFKAGGSWHAAKEVTVPARPMMPTGKLSPLWQKALERAAGEFITAKLR